MKRIKAAVSLVLCLAVLLSCAVSAGADIISPWPIGDADRSYKIDILDATKIQRFLAGVETPSQLELALSDADGSGSMTILDATAIQRMLADLPNDMVWGTLDDYYVTDYAFHSTAEIMHAGGVQQTEIAYVGVPVTFTAELGWGNPPQRFTLSVDGETVLAQDAEGRRSCELTYIFEQEGVYTVTVEAECKYGVRKTDERRVEVRSLPDDGSPVIMGATFFDWSRLGSGNGLLMVTAAGGTAPYEYRYLVYGSAGEPLDGMPVPDENAYDTGYVAGNTLALASLGEVLDGYWRLYIQVTVRDAEGKVSDPVTVGFAFFQVEL